MIKESCNLSGRQHLGLQFKNKYFPVDMVGTRKVNYFFLKKVKKKKIWGIIWAIKSL